MSTATTTKERPILFSAPMVRALIEGRKTQTRRLVKPQPTSSRLMNQTMWAHETLSGEFGERVFGACMASLSPCPYGVPGDRLWVRETWCPTVNRTLYRASCADDKPSANTDDWDSPADDRWRPSIHMPRSRSRMTLEVTRVRVERVQDITEADAVAEGAAGYLAAFDRVAGDKSTRGKWTAREEFEALWEAVNGSGAWARNDWVWAIDIRRVER